MAVTLLPEFKAFAHIDSADTTGDVNNAYVLARSQADVERVLGYQLDTATVTAELQDSCKIVFPAHPPVTTLTSVKYRPNPVDPTKDITLVEGTDYVQRRFMDGLTRYLELLTYITAESLRIVLSYVGGYAADYPGPIKSAIFLLAARELSMAQLQAPEVIPGDNRIVAAAKAKLIPFIRGTI